VPVSPPREPLDPTYLRLLAARKSEGTRFATDAETAEKAAENIARAFWPLADAIRNDVESWTRSTKSAVVARPDFQHFVDGRADIATPVYNAIRDYAKGRPREKVAATVRNLALRWFRRDQLDDTEKLFEQMIPGMRDLFPPGIVVDLDSNGNIAYIADRFENQTRDLEFKVLTNKLMASRWKAIQNRLREDFHAQNDATRTAATVLRLIAETGIRPGQHGNRVFVDETGRRVVRGGVREEPTYGAVTLLAEHVTFPTDGTARLEFRGKMGSVNRAEVRDPELVQRLREFVARGGSQLFTLRDGRAFDKNELAYYLNHAPEFEGIAATDFRKYVASQEALTDLYESLPRIARELASANAPSDERINSIVRQAVEQAMERAQKRLSHESSTTTKKSYINPEVVLSFLQGSVGPTLPEVVLRPIPFRYSPREFYAKARRTR
jgi:DNA topoisomerase IB